MPGNPPAATRATVRAAGTAGCGVPCRQVPPPGRRPALLPGGYRGRFGTRSSPEDSHESHRRRESEHYRRLPPGIIFSDVMSANHRRECPPESRRGLAPGAEHGEPRRGPPFGGRDLPLLSRTPPTPGGPAVRRVRRPRETRRSPRKSMPLNGTCAPGFGCVERYIRGAPGRATTGTSSPRPGTCTVRGDAHPEGRTTVLPGDGSEPRGRCPRCSTLPIPCSDNGIAVQKSGRS